MHSPFWISTDTFSILNLNSHVHGKMGGLLSIMFVRGWVDPYYLGSLKKFIRAVCPFIAL